MRALYKCGAKIVPILNITHVNLEDLVGYDIPKKNEDLICIYNIDNGYSIGDIRVWNKNNTFGEQEITSFIIHNKEQNVIWISWRVMD